MSNLLDTLKLPQDIKKLTIEQLNELAKEIRDLLIDVVIENGGHLASNLGIVDLTIALFYVFDIPDDKVIYDVGHQSYIHKILSGRYKDFSTIRKSNGISGFMNPRESEYDPFITGHSSTAISLSCGFMRANLLNNDTKSAVISVVGDGALTGGMAYEALNDVYDVGGKQIIIINDNNMSISSNVGSTSMYLKKLRISKHYLNFKRDVTKFIEGFKFSGNRVVIGLQKFKNSFKYLLNGKLPFDQYGIAYYGPIDGHNIKEIISFLNLAKETAKPLILHLITVKGKGFKAAELNPNEYHGVSPKSSTCNAKTFSSVFGETMCEIAEKNEKVVVTTAAMSFGTGLEEFSHKFPDRFFDVGIAEAHAVTMSAAMAKSGFKPYFAVYSTFLQRGFDQIMHDMCILDLPLTLAIDRAGIVGEDGETHQGIYDLSYLSLVPNMTIMSPKDINELRDMLIWSISYNHPLAIRYPKSSVNLNSCSVPIEYGKWEKLTDEGSDIVVIASGANIIKNCFDVKNLSNRKFEIINARFIKPLDYEMLDEIKGKKIITVEDNVITGGLGSQIVSYYNNKKINAYVTMLAFPDIFVRHASRCTLYEEYGLSAEKIAEKINNL